MIIILDQALKHLVDPLCNIPAKWALKTSAITLDNTLFSTF